jgi:DNA-binding beta-propeller fold protein YncE
MSDAGASVTAEALHSANAAAILFAAEDLQMAMLKTLWRAASDPAKTPPVVRATSTCAYREFKTADDVRRRAAACLTAMLCDVRNMAVFGARDGKPMSLASVHAAAALRFIGASFRGVVVREIAMPDVRICVNGLAITRDGTKLIVTDVGAVTRPSKLRVYRIEDGALLREIGSSSTDARADGPLQFSAPWQVCVAPDDFVFVTEVRNKRVQVLTPNFDFHAFIGVGELTFPSGVCANLSVVAVSDAEAHRVCVFARNSGALLRRFGLKGAGDGQLHDPFGLCFMPRNNIAVCDYSNRRVSVFNVDGAFVRHVKAGTPSPCFRPYCVACSSNGELIVTDRYYYRICIFSASGERVWRWQGTDETDGVAVYGGTIFAQTYIDKKCIVFQ